jgi:hypothetical protein
MFKTKIIVSTAMMLLFSICLMAQTSQWSIGIDAGPAISSLRGNNVSKSIQKSRLGSFAGLSLQYKLNQRFSLKTGLAHELKGAKYDVIFYDATSLNCHSALTIPARLPWHCTLPPIAYLRFEGILPLLPSNHSC